MKKTSLVLIAAGCIAGLLHTSPLALAQSNTIDFDSYPLGTLDTGNSAPWNKSGSATGTIVAAPGGGQALLLNGTGGGSLTLDTALSPLNPIEFPSANNISWSFDFLIPAGADPVTTYLRLNTGSANVGKYIAGMALKGGDFAYLRNPNLSSTANSFQNAPDVSLSNDVWYRVAFEISTTEGSGVSYAITLATASNPADALFTQTVAFAPNALSEDALRMTLSTDASTQILLRNITLSQGQIPEPAHAVALLALSAAFLCGLIRKRAGSAKS